MWRTSARERDSPRYPNRQPKADLRSAPSGSNRRAERSPSLRGNSHLKQLTISQRRSAPVSGSILIYPFALCADRHTAGLRESNFGESGDAVSGLAAYVVAEQPQSDALPRDIKSDDRGFPHFTYRIITMKRSIISLLVAGLIVVTAT